MTTIDAATVRDIPAIMRLERGEGFEGLVGRWSAEQHAAEMALPGSHYLVARRSHEVAGFVMLQQIDDPNGCVHLRRIAVSHPGAGLGAVLLDAALAHAFADASTHRVQLRVFPDNERALRAYRRIGFVEEGLLRDVVRAPDGRRRSMLMFSILRPEWEVVAAIGPRALRMREVARLRQCAAASRSALGRNNLPLGWQE